MKLFTRKRTSRKSNSSDIIKRSTKAVCGIMEREVMVRAERVGETKRRLKSSGFVVIGTSEPIGKFKKVWFIRAGGF